MLGLASLFLPYRPRGKDGSRRDAILEVQAVAPANARSWFVGQEVVAGRVPKSFHVSRRSKLQADGKLLVMTPIDPAFLLIPILQSVYPVSHRNCPGLAMAKLAAGERRTRKFPSSRRNIRRCCCQLAGVVYFCRGQGCLPDNFKRRCSPVHINGVLYKCAPTGVRCEGCAICSYFCYSS
jgi:hypothetical protein